jgi:integrase
MASPATSWLHFHDLRHTGNTLVAESGASPKELMRRMGHSNTRAAMIYQHATDKRDRVLAESLSEKIKDARLPKASKAATGT